MKKVRVIRNPEGQVVAAFEVPEEGDIQGEIELEPGQEMEEVDAPDDYQSDPDTFIKSHHKKPKKPKKP